MIRLLVLFLAFSLSLNALAAAHGICASKNKNQNSVHSHQTQNLSVAVSHVHNDGKSQTSVACKYCDACHANCVSPVLMPNVEIHLSSMSSQGVCVRDLVYLLLDPSDPPYRPKWPILA